MRHTFKKIISIGCLALGAALSLSPAVLAQENLFDTLDNLKENVEEKGRVDEATGKPVKVDLIDFSEDLPWGNLPEESIKKLKSPQVKSLEDVAREAGYKQSQNNAEALINYLAQKGFARLDASGNPLTDQNGVPFLTDEGNFVVNEIQYRGESQIRSVILSVVKVIRNLIAGIAIIWVIVSGIQMILANGDETKITQQRQSILYIILGLAAILLIERLIVLFYGVPGAERGIGTEGPGLSPEILGIISYLRSLVGIVALAMIMISGFKTIASQGEEEKIGNERKAILWIIIGIVVILINAVVVENLYIDPIEQELAAEQTNREADPEIRMSNVQNLINLLGNVIQFLLGFVGLIALAAFVYSGATMILNMGNDEIVTKSRKLMINAIIGIIVILSAYAIVATVIKFQ